MSNISSVHLKTWMICLYISLEWMNEFIGWQIFGREVFQSNVSKETRHSEFGHVKKIKLSFHWLCHVGRELGSVSKTSQPKPDCM